MHSSRATRARSRSPARWRTMGTRTPRPVACGGSPARPVLSIARDEAGTMTPLRDYLSPLPLIAVLRGIAPEEVTAVGRALHDQGFRVLEVPLNSPRPFESIRLMAREFGTDCLVGAGTVIAPADVSRVRDAGGKLIVMPHADA